MIKGEQKKIHHRIFKLRAFLLFAPIVLHQNKEKINEIILKKY